MRARWILPAVAALAVLLVVGVVWAQRPGRSDGDGSGASAPPTAGVEPGSPGSAAPSPAEPVPVSPMPGGDHLDPLRVVGSGYTSHGRTLTLSYATGLPECYGRLAAPRVDESPRSVTVTLRLVPPGHRTAQVCPDLALIATADVTLAAPLGDRLVRDGGRGGAVVPRGHPLGAPSPVE